MGFEVEVKYRVADREALAGRLAELGAEAAPTLDQEDIYLAHPARDFARTDEALRLRRIGRQNRITYKGPKRIGPTKTRPEIEVPFAEGPEALGGLVTLFETLGFRRVAAIRKVRRPHHLQFRDRALEVVLDEAEGLGSFAEVETLAGGEADLPAAQAAVLDLAGALGLTEVEPRSYLRMTLERLGMLDPGGAAGPRPAGEAGIWAPPPGRG